MKKLLLILFLASLAGADTHECDGSVSDCQAKVDLSTDGDSVTFPSGTHSYNWNSFVTIGNKSISLVGRGAGVTTLNDSTGAGALFKINGTTKLPRITGLTFSGDSVGNDYAAIDIRVVSSAPAKGFRIDHNAFNYVHGNRVIWVDNAYGVIDNNEFNASEKYIALLVRENNTGDFPGGVGYNGNVSWARGSEFGTDNAVFFEDNTVTFGDCESQAIDSDFGSRVVVRYNDFVNTTIGMHGPGQAPSRGALQNEFYGNTIEVTSGCSRYYQDAIYVNSGTGLMFFNRSFGAGEDETIMRFQIQHYRDNVLTASTIDKSFDVQCDGETHTPRVDGNTADMHGYPCGDQPGFDGELLSQFSSPLYCWGNKNLDTLQKFLAPSTSGSGYIQHVVENRDFYNQNVSFDGTSGIGAGALGSRSLTCAAGVGYWATSQTAAIADMSGVNPAAPISGTFYKATATNTWTEYYTPYTYPHPLRGAIKGICNIRIKRK
jgi:hypothetical protein